MFKDNVREIFLDSKKRTYERDAVILMRVANIIRNKIFKSTHHRFTGQLTDEQYEDKILSLLALVQMVLGGRNIQNQIKNNHVVKTAAISIIESKT